MARATDCQVSRLGRLIRTSNLAALASYLMMGDEAFATRIDGSSVRTTATPKPARSNRRAWVGIGLVVVVAAVIVPALHLRDGPLPSEGNTAKASTGNAATVVAPHPNPPECQRLKYELGDDIVAAIGRPFAERPVGSTGDMVEWQYPTCILTLKRETHSGDGGYRVSDTRGAPPANRTPVVVPASVAAPSKPANARADLLDCHTVLYERLQGKNFLERADIIQNAQRQGICQ